MQFARKIALFKVNENTQISYNYQYDIMKSIYYYISTADKILEKFLHDEGYRVKEGHKYKLFNFALRFENANFNKDYISLTEKSIIKLIISGKKEIVKNILKGLFHIKKIKIDKKEFILKDIVEDKKISFTNIMLYKCLNPVIESTKNDLSNIVYLSPYESKYYENLAKNLMKKYRLIYEEDFKEQLFFDIDDAFKIKRKCMTIKNVNMIGYTYDIWVETTPKMQKVLYYLGLGQNNSVGAGSVDFITSRKGEFSAKNI